MAKQGCPGHLWKEQKLVSLGVSTCLSYLQSHSFPTPFRHLGPSESVFPVAPIITYSWKNLVLVITPPWQWDPHLLLLPSVRDPRIRETRSLYSGARHQEPGVHDQGLWMGSGMMWVHKTRYLTRGKWEPSPKPKILEQGLRWEIFLHQEGGRFFLVPDTYTQRYCLFVIYTSHS